VLSLNCRVALRSFNGMPTTPVDCRADENFWMLIGQVGTVVEATNARARVLVKFDCAVPELGLACHNPIPNSLYILETDLKRIQ
jgi:hypothetical protein